MRMRWLVCVAFFSCGGEVAIPNPDAAAKAHSAPRGADLATRRARFEARKTVPLPAELPSAWAAFASAIEGRITAISHSHFIQVEQPFAHRSVSMQVRVFGADADVDSQLLAGLRGLDLPGLSAGLPADEVADGAVRWSIERFPLIAPAGEAREHRIELRWRRQPVPAVDRPKCRKPRPAKVPAEAPGWFGGWAKSGATRRAVGSTVAIDGKGCRIELVMLYWNGFAHDEAVGLAMKTAERQGMKHQRGEGPDQVWRGRDGEWRWSPDRGELYLGCEVAGPVLRVTWTEDGG